MCCTNEACVNFIVGTDWWTDCDDAVAFRLLARAHRQGRIRLLGVGVNACMPLSVPSLDAFLTHEGLKDLPIGLDAEATDFGGAPPYQKRLAALPGSHRANADCPDAVSLYRKLLAEADGPVELIEIGYPQVLANLLHSKPDGFSPLGGTELVRKKVRRLWIMAGKWDEPVGRENNFARNARAAAGAHTLCKEFPCPMIFLGWEVGHTVCTGGALPADDILHLALCDHGSAAGRCSWDPMLVLMAITQDVEKAGYAAVRGTASADPQTGENRFTESKDGRHCYVVKQRPDAFYQKEIDTRIGG